jgi:hypothetical protein
MVTEDDDELDDTIDDSDLETTDDGKEDSE